MRRKSLLFCLKGNQDEKETAEEYAQGEGDCGKDEAGSGGDREGTGPAAVHQQAGAEAERRGRILQPPGFSRGGFADLFRRNIYQNEPDEKLLPADSGLQNLLAGFPDHRHAGGGHDPRMVCADGRLRSGGHGGAAETGSPAQREAGTDGCDPLGPAVRRIPGADDHPRGEREAGPAAGPGRAAAGLLPGAAGAGPGHGRDSFNGAGVQSGRSGLRAAGILHGGHEFG